jgi:pyruvate, orthophosphate dikinase
MELAHRLERHCCDAQDVEFTIENGRLFLLQTRNAKRTATAAVKIAVDMVNEGMISQEEALQRVDPEEISQLLVPCFNNVDVESDGVQSSFLTQGALASPGAAAGKVYFDAAKAVEAA